MPPPDAERRPSRSAVQAAAGADLSIGVIEAAEAFHAAARAYGLDPIAIGLLHAPWQLRADAWCWRVERERAEWAAIFASPLFAPRETLWPVAA